MGKVWADQPYALLTLPGSPGQPTSSNKDVLDMAVEMAHVHNALLRGLNSIYLQCQQVHEPKDVSDFCTYITTWGDTVHHHHHNEETNVFPAWEKVVVEAGGKEGVMARNVEQHHAFEGGFEALRTYAADVKAGQATYDGKKVTALIDTFGPVLNEHLHDEVKLILELEPYDGPVLKKIIDEAAQEALKTADPNLVIPFAIGCTDRTAPGGTDWPPFPFFMPYLNYFWFAPKNKSVWRFSPSDAWSRPRPLMFLKPQET